MKTLCFVFLLAFSCSTLAQKLKSEIRPHWHFALSNHAILERGENQQTTPMHLPGLMVGLEYEGWVGAFEYQKGSADSGQTGDALMIDREIEFAHVWVSHGFGVLTRGLTFDLGLGLGASREMVDTQLFDQSTRLGSGWGAVLGAKLGPRYRLPFAQFLSVALEGRLLKSPRLDPDPMFSIGANLIVTY